MNRLHEVSFTLLGSINQPKREIPELDRTAATAGFLLGDSVSVRLLGDKFTPGAAGAARNLVAVGRISGKIIENSFKGGKQRAGAAAEPNSTPTLQIALKAPSGV